MSSERKPAQADPDGSLSHAEEEAPAEEHSRLVQQLSLFGAFVPIVAITVGVLFFRDDIEDLHTIGYAGIFVSNVIGSGSFVLPVPGIATVVFGATLWNPFLVAVAGGTGSTIGEIAAYLAGVGSYGLVRRVVGRNRWYVKWYGRLRGWIEARGIITIFIFAATPNPFFDLAGFAAGSMKYPLSRFILACWLGKMVKYGFVSYAAFWGADMFYGWFE